MQVCILGCGYTGTRVARLLRARGVGVFATTRDPARRAALAAEGVVVGTLDDLVVPAGTRLLHSIPVDVPLDRWRPARVVYLSSTGVYGEAPAVDHTTPAAPVTDRQRARIAVEARVRGGPWSALVLRPAAIYGPGRGVHVALREGRYRLAGSRIGSRIHVDDLARHCVAGLLGDLEGAFPVADDRPAPAREVAGFVADRLGLPRPPSVPPEALPETRRFSRRVDGRAVRAALGITLRYPTYREGIPAALVAEAEAEGA